ncbi:unnamed protein product [Diplocarpon coronariae]|uniref:Uncharacterized protein n=1 Tax=Diplocarpon coronariae TaxID=2795749 RepID=A0A218Z0G0_9HELO|nr:hypothetical protein B2J93_8476 [Marssonina coronariae]
MSHASRDAGTSNEGLPNPPGKRKSFVGSRLDFTIDEGQSAMRNRWQGLSQNPTRVESSRVSTSRSADTVRGLPPPSKSDMARRHTHTTLRPQPLHVDTSQNTESPPASFCPSEPSCATDPMAIPDV